ncbi:UNVERIFIED_CONTAM: hypothetical protein PYX00_011773 [Menopon gallinae]|uniref:CCR4-NOT transcription complex subunit 9 n=1 Tax=Menopon gallinae TaxID=328185 RepID=A0AAW2H8I3_9NEOP
MPPASPRHIAPCRCGAGKQIPRRVICPERLLPLFPLMNSEVASVYVNLLKTVVGAALVKYPSLFVRYGVVPTIAISLMSALFAYLGLVLYTELNRASGTKADISSLARCTRIPLMETVVNAVIFLKCYSVIIIYMQLLRDVLKTLLWHFFGSERYHLALLVIVTLATPLTFTRSIRSLRVFSLFGVCSVVLIVLLCTCRFAAKIGSLRSTELAIVTRSRDYASDLGTFVFSYTCHQNVLSVQNSLRNTSRRGFRCVMLAVLATSVAIYSAFGIMSGLVLGEKINREGNVLNVLPKDGLSLFLRLFYGIAMVFTIPLHSHPGTHYGLCMLGAKYAREKEFWHVRWAFSSLMLLLMCFFVWADPEGRFTTFNLVGGVFSSLINLGFPGLYYLTFKDLNKSRGNLLLSVAVLLFAAVNIACMILLELNPEAQDINTRVNAMLEKTPQLPALFLTSSLGFNKHTWNKGAEALLSEFSLERKLKHPTLRNALLFEKLKMLVIRLQDKEKRRRYCVCPQPGHCSVCARNMQTRCGATVLRESVVFKKIKQPMKPGLSTICKSVMEAADKGRTYRQALEYLSEYPEEATGFWRYQGISIVFLQEITRFYEVLEANSQTIEDCTNICNLINILQTLALNENVRGELIRIQLPFFLYPFLNSSSTTQKNELIRAASLGFINVFIRSNDPDIIVFFRKTEIIPLALKCMDIGATASKVLASNIFLFILRNREGLQYAVQTAERFVAISVMLNLVLGHCVHIKSNDVLRNILECYVILSTEENVRLSFGSSFPKNLGNEKIMEKIRADGSLRELFLKFYKAVRPGSVLKHV